MPLAQVEHLESLHGTKLLRTLRYHAEHAVVHVVLHGADVARLLDQEPEHLQELVKNNALITAQHLNRAVQRFGKG
jgi:plasmid maintenance system antidote protein VapI